MINLERPSKNEYEKASAINKIFFQSEKGFGAYDMLVEDA
jgi:hypothetical protein